MTPNVAGYPDSAGLGGVYPEAVIGAWGAVRAGAAGVGRMLGGGIIRFGANSNQVYHAFRHTDAAGLSRNQLQSQIRSDIARNPLNSGINNRTVNVQGLTVDYSACQFPDKAINVGRITVRGQ